jgi:peptidoglycan/LPS O-acetylase OafA/YrhL
MDSILKNPTGHAVSALLAQAGSAGLRGIEDYSGVVYVWPYGQGTHMMMAGLLGIPYDSVTDYVDKLIGSTVAFATGAMIWHFRDQLPRSHAGAGRAAVMAVTLLGLVMSPRVGAAGGLYLGLAVAAAAVIALRDVPETAFGRRCGELAYPVFLLHMPMDKIVRG